MYNIRGFFELSMALSLLNSCFLLNYITFLLLCRYLCNWLMILISLWANLVENSLCLDLVRSDILVLYVNFLHQFLMVSHKINEDSDIIAGASHLDSRFLNNDELVPGSLLTCWRLQTWSIRWVINAVLQCTDPQVAQVRKLDHSQSQKNNYWRVTGLISLICICWLYIKTETHRRYPTYFCDIWP